MLERNNSHSRHLRDFAGVVKDNSTMTMRQLQKTLHKYTSSRLAVVAEFRFLFEVFQAKLGVDVQALQRLIDSHAAKLGPNATLAELAELLKLLDDEMAQEAAAKPASQPENKKQKPEDSSASSEKRKEDVTKANNKPSEEANSGQVGNSGEATSGSGSSSGEMLDSKGKGGEMTTGAKRKPVNIQNQRGQGTADPPADAKNSDRGNGDVANPSETDTVKSATSEVGDATTKEVQGPSATDSNAALNRQQDLSETGGSGERGAYKTEVGDAGNSTSLTNRASAETPAPEPIAAMKGQHAGNTESRAEMPEKKVGEEGTGETSEKKPDLSNNKSAAELRKLERALNRSVKVASANLHSRNGRSSTAFDSLVEHGIEPALVKRVQSVLASWVATSQTAVTEETSHRYNATKLASRLITHRDPFQNTYREELSKPSLLVMCDVSGSCSGFSGEVVLLGRAIGAMGMVGIVENVLVVSHVNGEPYEWQSNGKPIAEKRIENWKQQAGAAERNHYSTEALQYEAACQELGITHIIACGDSDALEVFQKLVASQQVEALIWLDNHGCNQHGPQLNRTDWGFGRDKDKVRYVTGCKAAPQFLEGLQLAIRTLG